MTAGHGTTRRQRLEELFARKSLPAAACSRSFLASIQSLQAGGIVGWVRAGAGRRLEVRNIAALRAFIDQAFPLTPTPEGTAPRIQGVANARDSKSIRNDAAQLVLLRSVSDRVLKRGDAWAPTAELTDAHGVFAFLLTPASAGQYVLHGSCGLFENPAVFQHWQSLPLQRPPQTAIYGGGRVSQKLLRWLAGHPGNAALSITHFPDYDPVGIDDYLRLKSALGEHVDLHEPSDLRQRFARYSNPKLLQHRNSQRLLSKVRNAVCPEIQRVVALIDQYNAGLEQEALFLD